jgi:hypothetical protein
LLKKGIAWGKLKKWTPDMAPSIFLAGAASTFARLTTFRKFQAEPRLKLSVGF